MLMKDPKMSGHPASTLNSPQYRLNLAGVEPKKATDGHGTPLTKQKQKLVWIKRNGSNTKTAKLVFSDIFVQTNPRGVVPSLVQT